MSYAGTVLNGLIDDIIGAAFYFVNWIFHNILGFVLKFVYEATIYVPLVCINAIAIIFRFFCGGFANYIFGDGHQLFDPSTGRIDMSGWSLTSPLGVMVYFSFIVSLIFFFIFFLLTFRGGAKNDQGQPIQGAWMRFAAMKWPLFMIMSLYLMPYLFVLADYFMQQLMLFFNNSLAKSFTQDDLNKLVGNFEADFRNFSNNIGTASVSGGSISGLQFAGVLGDLQSKCQALINWNDTTGLASYWGESLANLQSDLNSAQNYVNSGATADSQTMANMIGTFQVGGYISTDNLAAIETIKGNMNSFFELMTSGFAADSSKLNSDVFDNVWRMAGYSVAEGGAGVTKSDLLTPLNAIVDTWNNGGTGTLHDFKNLANMLANGVNSSGAYDPSRYICLADLQNHVAGISNFQMVGIIYSLATGDPNPNNWSDPYGNDFAHRADVLRWVTSVFAVWGMILIVYTYVSEAMKRTYYLIGYWVIGFFYLANGMTQTNAAIKWYKQIFFRWFGVILIMICFEMSGILVTAIVPVIQAALNLPVYSYGGSQVLVILGVILAMEAGFQVGYLIYQKFMGEAGAGAENFKYQAPTLLSSGNDLFNSALSNAEYYGTGGPIKDAYNKVSDYKEYWAKKNDAKLKRESTDFAIAERAAKQDTMKKSINEAGYNVNFAGPHGLHEPVRAARPYDPKHGQDDPKKAAAGGGGGGGAGGGGGGGAAAGPKKVRVPVDFTDYRASNTPGQDKHVSRWTQGDTIGRRIQNLGRGLWTNIARGGEAVHNAGATVLRKTGLAGIITGAAGFFGGETGMLNARRAVGTSTNRMTRAEKEWAKAHGVSVAKNSTTGDVEIYPQGSGQGPGPDTSLTGRLGSSQLHNTKLWYNDDVAPIIAPAPGPAPAPAPAPGNPPPPPPGGQLGIQAQPPIQIVNFAQPVPPGAFAEEEQNSEEEMAEAVSVPNRPLEVSEPQSVQIPVQPISNQPLAVPVHEYESENLYSNVEENPEQEEPIPVLEQPQRIAEQQRIPVAEQPQRIAESEHESENLYSNVEENPEQVKIPVLEEESHQRIPVAEQPQGIAENEQNENLFVETPEEEQQLLENPIAEQPQEIVEDAQSENLYSNVDENPEQVKIPVLEEESHQRIPVAEQPQGIAENEQNENLFIETPEEEQQLLENPIAEQLPVAEQPQEIAENEQNENLFVETPEEEQQLTGSEQWIPEQIPVAEQEQGQKIPVLEQPATETPLFGEEEEILSPINQISEGLPFDVSTPVSEFEPGQKLQNQPQQFNEPITELLSEPIKQLQEIPSSSSYHTSESESDQELNTPLSSSGAPFNPSRIPQKTPTIVSNPQAPYQLPVEEIGLPQNQAFDSLVPLEPGQENPQEIEYNEQLFFPTLIKVPKPEGESPLNTSAIEPEKENEYYRGSGNASDEEDEFDLTPVPERILVPEKEQFKPTNPISATSRPSSAPISEELWTSQIPSSSSESASETIVPQQNIPWDRSSDVGKTSSSNVPLPEQQNIPWDRSDDSSESYYYSTSGEDNNKPVLPPIPEIPNYSTYSGSAELPSNLPSFGEMSGSSTNSDEFPSNLPSFGEMSGSSTSSDEFPSNPPSFGEMGDYTSTTSPQVPEQTSSGFSVADENFPSFGKLDGLSTTPSGSSSSSESEYGSQNSSHLPSEPMFNSSSAPLISAPTNSSILEDSLSPNDENFPSFGRMGEYSTSSSEKTPEPSVISQFSKPVVTSGTEESNSTRTSNQVLPPLASDLLTGSNEESYSSFESDNEDEEGDLFAMPSTPGSWNSAHTSEAPALKPTQFDLDKAEDIANLHDQLRHLDPRRDANQIADVKEQLAELEGHSQSSSGLTQASSKVSTAKKTKKKTNKK